MNQLGLPISLNSKMLLDNFIANSELVNLIHQLFQKKKASEIYVYGLTGQGKTHVLQGVVLKALEVDMNAIYIDCIDSFPEHLFDFIGQLNFISFDNVDLINSHNQETFFDLYNRARQAGVVILVSGSGLPADLNVMTVSYTHLTLPTIYSV